MQATVLREQVIQLLHGRNAHYTFEDAVKNFPLAQINTKPVNVPYTFWHLLEHLRIAQLDILDFMRNPNHGSPEWPTGYWPEANAMTDETGWQNTITAFLSDRQAILDMVANPDIDPAAELSHAPGYTYLREYLLTADHNAYHIGELAILRQVAGCW